MIGYVKGILEEADDQCIIVDNHGIGYRIFVPGSVFSGAIPIGQEVKIYTYLNVKEDAMQLYGFATRDDLRVFKLLLGVNGIGPKAGLGILSALSADDLRFAVLADDAAAIAKAPGIGKKTAQKLILELKDKLDLEDAFEQKLANQSAAGIPETEGDNQLQEAVQALVALGYPNTDALRAVKKVEGAETMDVETLLKAALNKRARGSLLTLGERRMAIMIAAKAASSTAGANHDIMSAREPEGVCSPLANGEEQVSYSE